MYNSKLEMHWNLALFLVQGGLLCCTLFFQLRPEFTDVVSEMEQLPRMIVTKGMEATSIGQLCLLQDFVCCTANALKYAKMQIKGFT